jgi:hypothetical protein
VNLAQSVSNEVSRTKVIKICDLLTLSIRKKSRCETGTSVEPRPPTILEAVRFQPVVSGVFARWPIFGCRPRNRGRPCGIGTFRGLCSVP